MEPCAGAKIIVHVQNHDNETGQKWDSHLLREPSCLKGQFETHDKDIACSGMQGCTGGIGQN